MQGAVDNDSARPESFQELVFADHPVAMADQIGEEIEDSWLQRDLSIAEAQLAPLLVDLEVCEFVCHGTTERAGVFFLGRVSI